MLITPYKTDLVKQHDDLFAFLDKAIPALEEKSIVVITSKIIALMQGRVVAVGSIEKDELIQKEASLYLPRATNKYNQMFTITNNLLIINAGIDESNANGYYILWPEHLQEVANHIREYLTKKFHLTYVGVMITDSRTTPMRWGTTGICLAYSGLQGINNLIGQPDLFGKKLEVTQVNVVDSLASAAVFEMGEANEQQPLAIITHLSNAVQFQDHNPTPEELNVNTTQITLEDDMYGQFFTAAPWQKGKK